MKILKTDVQNLVARAEGIALGTITGRFFRVVQNKVPAIVSVMEDWQDVNNETMFRNRLKALANKQTLSPTDIVKMGVILSLLYNMEEE